MIRRRETHDPLAPGAQPRWLVVWDMQFAALQVTELAPQTDLRQTLQQCMQQWRDGGWTVENDGRFGSFFCHRAGERRLVAISPVDPAHANIVGPSWYERCPTCGHD